MISLAVLHVSTSFSQNGIKRYDEIISACLNSGPIVWICGSLDMVGIRDCHKPVRCRVLKVTTRRLCQVANFLTKGVNCSAWQRHCSEIPNTNDRVGNIRCIRALPENGNCSIFPTASLLLLVDLYTKDVHALRL